MCQANFFFHWCVKKGYISYIKTKDSISFLAIDLYMNILCIGEKSIEIFTNKKIVEIHDYCTEIIC